MSDVPDPYMAAPDPYVVPVDERSNHAPEWEELEHGYGQEHNSLLKVEWDNISDEVRVTGPKVLIDPPERPL